MLDCQFHSVQHGFELDVSLQSTAAMLGITGDSGVGKTTFLKHILGIYSPQHGHIRLQNHTLFDASSQQNIACRKRRIAMIFQRPCLFPHLNVMQNLHYAQRWLKPQGIMQSAEVIEVLQLSALLKRSVHQLSGGEAQRVSIGRALLAEPQLLLLDEPLTGLHAELRAQCLYYLKLIQQQWNIPMIYVTHHLEELEQLNAVVIAMHHGCLKHDDSV